MNEKLSHLRQRYFNVVLLLLVFLTGCAGNMPVSSANPQSPAADGISMQQCKTYIGPNQKNLSKKQLQALTHLGLGLGYLAEDVLETAQKNLDTAIALDPQLARAYAGKAVLDIRMQQMESAGNYYRKAFRLAPGDPEINNNYGLYLCNQGQYEQADRHFRCAIANPIYDTPAQAYMNAARCALTAEKPAQALQDLGTAALLQPNSYVPSLLMAEAHYQLGQFDQAARNFGNFSTRGNLSPSALWLGIKIYRETGHLDKVASYSLLLRNRFPDSKEADLLRQQ